jgi:hypothetical protein
MSIHGCISCSQCHHGCPICEPMAHKDCIDKNGKYKTVTISTETWGYEWHIEDGRIVFYNLDGVTEDEALSHFEI